MGMSFFQKEFTLIASGFCEFQLSSGSGALVADYSQCDSLYCPGRCSILYEKLKLPTLKQTTSKTMFKMFLIMVAPNSRVYSMILQA